ncbi:MAG: hypothetical protein HYY25_07290 [Candidatus Wallbacteria bacterium]|nr:hypothetical protein [Candidatus Wallbacteria bacterium]
MSTRGMTAEPMGRPDFEQRHKRRSLFEEISRIRANAQHRRIQREARARSADALQTASNCAEARAARLEPDTAASVRRGWQLRRQLGRAARVAAAAILASALTLGWLERATATAAGSVARGFLEAASHESWGAGRDKYFSSWLKEVEPPDRFARDIQLLESKLGRVVGFELTRATPAWTSRQCDLHYNVTFEKGQAQGFFELLREDGRWVVDTFCFLAPRWKRL